MLGATAAFLAGSQGCGEFAGPSLGRESRRGVKSSETVPGSAVRGEQCAEKPYILRAQTMSSHRLLPSFFFFKPEFYYLWFWGGSALFQPLCLITRLWSRWKELRGFELVLDFGPVNLCVCVLFWLFCFVFF